MTQQDATTQDSLTLDPPGTIAVVGAGPTGLETALYGRYLGYDVHIIEADSIAASWAFFEDDDLPMTPGDCLSPLAKSAIAAQRAASPHAGSPGNVDDPTVWPLTIGGWIKECLRPLAESDLLRGRIIAGKVTAIDAVEVDSTDVDPDDGDIPPDFRLTIEEGDPPRLIVEAVILTPADVTDIAMKVPADADYLFRIHNDDVVAARRRIVAVFAELGGRADLDLYRPQRV